MEEATETAARFMREIADRLRRMASRSKSALSPSLRRIAHELDERADELKRPINEEALNSSD